MADDRIRRGTPLLAEEDFRAVSPREGWDRTTRLSARWTAFISSESEPRDRSIRHSPGDGLRMAWGDAPQRVRLFQLLDLRAIRRATINATFQCRFVCPPDFDWKATIEWVAIQLDRVGGAVTLERFKTFETVVEPDALCFVGTCSIPDFACDQTHRFTIQLKSSAHEARLFRIELDLLPDGDEDREPAARAPVAAGPASPAAPRLIAPAAPRPAAQVAPAAIRAPALEAASASAGAARPAARPGASGILIPAPRTISRRKRVVVAPWTLTHNPVGRAYVLAEMLGDGYDVELMGPLFRRFGADVWEPIRRTAIARNTFIADDMASLLDFAEDFVSGVSADYVYVCKPRLPGMLLGLLMKQKLGCPALIDVDDDELSFFARKGQASSEAEAARRAADDLRLPFSATWTAAVEPLIAEFDAVTCASLPLQRRFGGVMVRHARDERAYDRTPTGRQAVRAEFGYADADRVVLFLGTPRAHKGLRRLAQALHETGDPRLHLLIVGSFPNAGMQAELAGFTNAQIKAAPDQPWSRIPEIVNAADAIVLLQDPDAATSKFQIPAKLTDALAMGVPLAVTDVEPLREFFPTEALFKINDDGDLKRFLGLIAGGEFDREAHYRRSRQLFLSEFSFGVNRARLDLALQLASEANARPRETPLSAHLFRRLNASFGSRLPELARAPAG